LFFDNGLPDTKQQIIAKFKKLLQFLSKAVAPRKSWPLASFAEFIYFKIKNKIMKISFAK